MTSPAIHRDERTLAVENQSYKWAFHVFAYGLLAIVAYRSFAAGETNWDLLALVVIAGGVASAYQWTHNVLTRRSAGSIAAGLLLAVLVAAAVAWLR